jgi:hypothetical protein
MSGVAGKGVQDILIFRGESSMVFPESLWTGTAISENTVRAYSHEAGYRNVLVLEIENPFYRFYQLQP